MIGTTKEKEEYKKKVNLVNKLIENSFGKNFSGDWHTNKGVRVGWFNDGFERKCELNYVRKKNFRDGNFIYAAMFWEKDGSAMIVNPEHYVSALKYSLLYKQATGKEVKLRAPEGRDLY